MISSDDRIVAASNTFEAFIRSDEPENILQFINFSPNEIHQTFGPYRNYLKDKCDIGRKMKTIYTISNIFFIMLVVIIDGESQNKLTTLLEFAWQHVIGWLENLLECFSKRFDKIFVEEKICVMIIEK